MSALEITNLVKTFGGLRATDDLTFRVGEGESIGLIGPNGAGKTTVFSQIMGELRQTSGTIRLFGDDISGLGTPERIRRGVSRTYQVPRPFAGMSVDSFALTAAFLADTASHFDLSVLIGAVLALVVITVVGVAAAKAAFRAQAFVEKLNRITPFIMIASGAYILASTVTDVM